MDLHGRELSPLFDVGDLATAPDPHAALAELRAHGRVVRLASGFVAVTGHAEAVAVLRGAAFGSGPIGASFEQRLPPGAARDEMAHRINFLDPPDHPRVRGLVAKAFTPRRIEALLPWIAGAAEDLVAGVDASGTFDLLAEVAHQLPSLVISELLGVPLADRDQLTAWSDAVTPLLGTGPTPDEVAGAVAAAEAFHAYLGDLLDDRAAHPGDDLLTALVHAEEDGERLTRVELLSLAATMYSAGHRTTRDAFANGMAVLLAGDGGRYRSLVRGCDSPAAVAAELLRVATPTLYVVRVAAEATEVGGVELVPGDLVIVYLGAANRDPIAYPDPDEVRPGREGPPVLSFAYGAHYCLGASLARAELEVLLVTVSRAWPSLHLAEGPVFHQRGPFRGVDRLLVAAG